MGYYESKRRGALVNPTIEIGNVNASTNALMGNLNNFVSNQRQQDAVNVQQAQREEALALEAEKYKAAQTRLATQDAMAATAFNTQQLIRNNQLAEYGRKVDQRNTLADLNKNFTTVGMKQGMGLTEADINAQYSKANDAYEKGLVTKGLDRTNEQIAAMSPKQRDAWRESTKGLYTDPFDNGKGTGQADFEKKYLKSFNTATDATYTQRHDAIIKAYTDKGIPLDVAEQQAALRLKGAQTEAQKAESWNKAAEKQYAREMEVYKVDPKYQANIIKYNESLQGNTASGSTKSGKDALSDVFKANGVKAKNIAGSLNIIDDSLMEVNKALPDGVDKFTTDDITKYVAASIEEGGFFSSTGVNSEALKALIISGAKTGDIKHTKKGTPIALPDIKEPKYKTYTVPEARTAQELLDIYKEPTVSKVNNLETISDTIKNTENGTVGKSISPSEKVTPLTGGQKIDIINTSNEGVIVDKDGKAVTNTAIKSKLEKVREALEYKSTTGAPKAMYSFIPKEGSKGSFAEDAGIATTDGSGSKKLLNYQNALKKLSEKDRVKYFESLEPRYREQAFKLANTLERGFITGNVGSWGYDVYDSTTGTIGDIWRGGKAAAGSVYDFLAYDAINKDPDKRDINTRVLDAVGKSAYEKDTKQDKYNESLDTLRKVFRGEVPAITVPNKSIDELGKTGPITASKNKYIKQLLSTKVLTPKSYSNLVNALDGGTPEHSTSTLSPVEPIRTKFMDQDVLATKVVDDVLSSSKGFEDAIRRFIAVGISADEAKTLAMNYYRP